MGGIMKLTGSFVERLPLRRIGYWINSSIESTMETPISKVGETEGGRERERDECITRILVIVYAYKLMYSTSGVGHRGHVDKC